MKKQITVTILCIILSIVSGCGDSSSNISEPIQNDVSHSKDATIDEVLSFDLDTADFKNDIVTVLQPFGYSLVSGDIGTSSTYSFGVVAPDATTTYIHLLLDANSNIVNVDISQNGSDSFVDVALAAIIVTNPCSDFNSLKISLGLENYATSNIENSKIKSVSGITYTFSCGRLSIQRDSDDTDSYTKHPLSAYTSANPSIYADISDNSSVVADSSSSASIPAYVSAQYKVGVDIPAGEYVLIGESSYFAITSDANGSDIIFNENFDNDYIVTLNDGEYFTLKRGTAYPFEQYCSSNTIDTSQSSCMLKIGVNLPAGEYKLSSANGDGYYCIYTDSRCSDIVANDNFDSSTYITVSDGQYLLFKRCTLQ